MKTFRTILSIVPVRLPPRYIQHLIRNALVLGRWLKCEVHFLSSESEVASIEDTISSFKSAFSDSPESLVIRQEGDTSVARILGVMQTHSCDLVLMQDSVVLHETKGADERRLLEESPAPVFLIPRDSDFVMHPPSAFLAPLSGEQRSSEAAAIALALAAQTKSPIDFLHVTTPGESCACGQEMEGLGDQLHHEYQQMVDKIASEASPYSTPEERSRIRHFYHCRGLKSDEIAKILDESSGTVLVLEWNGTLEEGRAATIKSILKNNHHAILFVRSSKEARSTLRVGKHLRAS